MCTIGNGLPKSEQVTVLPTAEVLVVVVVVALRIPLAFPSPYSFLLATGQKNVNVIPKFDSRDLQLEMHRRCRN